jgi:hypothetical protein
MTASLLTLLLSAAPIVAPPGDVPPGESKGRSTTYNPSVPSPAGHASVVGGQTGPVATPAGTASVTGSFGYVYEPAFCMKKHLHGSPVPYEPRAGDIVLIVSDTVIWPILYAFALTSEPYHAAIIVQMPDGTFRMLEAGPPEMADHIRLVPIPERFEEQYGRVYIRRRAEPLTPEQSEALTGFALRQEGKPYAYVRFLGQATPFRTRGPVRTHHVGKSRGEPCSYFCTELVMEALVSAGLVDVETARPRATVMKDLFYDESTNPYINQHLKLYPCWLPPQQWVSDRCVAGTASCCGK